MSKLLYHIFIVLYHSGIRLASLWNPKAELWVKGRRSFPALPPDGRKTVWMHCASLGEFEQGRPLLEEVRRKYSSVKIVLSFFSPSGYEVMKNYPGADHIFYLPADSKINATKFIDVVKPDLVLWVKYEFWYYYLTTLKQRNIPVLMVAGLFRKEQPFFTWYGSMWRQMLSCFHHFFVQNETSKDLLGTLAMYDTVSVGGDTRFDRVIAIAEKKESLPLIEAFCGTDKVMVAGSTWQEDEEELIHYVKSNPQIKFIIAPHEVHEGNIKDVAAEFTGSIRYAALMNGAVATGHVLIIDNIGLLSKLYQYAHICYVGGGFEDSGIHNVLEPAVYGKPVIFGPEYEKFAEAVGLVECGAAIPVNNALELEKVLQMLWTDEAVYHKKSAAAKNYVYNNAGATQTIIKFIQENRLLTN